MLAGKPLAAEFLAGKMPDAEDTRRLTDRLSALAARRRAADAVALYETLLARGIPVPLWAERDVAGSYLELRRPQEALALYQRAVDANADDFDANLGLFFVIFIMYRIRYIIENISQLRRLYIKIFCPINNIILFYFKYFFRILIIHIQNFTKLLN